MAGELDREALRSALERNPHAFDRHADAFSTYEETVAASMALSDATHVAQHCRLRPHHRRLRPQHRRLRARRERLRQARRHARGVELCLKDLHAESAAQREVILRLIDRLGEGGGQQA